MLLFLIRLFYTFYQYLSIFSYLLLFRLSVFKIGFVCVYPMFILCLNSFVMCLIVLKIEKCVNSVYSAIRSRKRLMKLYMLFQFRLGIKDLKTLKITTVDGFPIPQSLEFTRHRVTVRTLIRTIIKAVIAEIVPTWLQVNPDLNRELTLRTHLRHLLCSHWVDLNTSQMDYFMTAAFIEPNLCVIWRVIWVLIIVGVCCRRGGVHIYYINYYICLPLAYSIFV